MILQTDSRLPEAINRWGCLFMSLIYICNKNMKIEDIIKIYNEAIQKGFISKEVFRNGALVDGCTVLNKLGVVNLINKDIKEYIKYDWSYIKKVNEVAIYEFYRPKDYPDGFKNDEHTHFVVAESVHDIRYDPMGDSQTVRYGYVVSIRVFK